MRNIELKQIVKVLKNFNVNETITGCIPYGNGHINDTFLVLSRNAEGNLKRYILQALNTNVFKKPENVMENIEKVTTFLRKKTNCAREVMTLVKTKDNHSFYKDDNDLFWRMYDFIEDSICLEHPDTTEDFYQCAVAFGRFQRDLSDFPAETLHETIIDFHNTPKRYQDFLSAVEADVCGRAAGVKEEIEFIKERADFYSVLYDAQKNGKLPLRVTHNDTKSNNVMLDAKTRKAVNAELKMR